MVSFCASFCAWSLNIRKEVSQFQTYHRCDFTACSLFRVEQGLFSVYSNNDQAQVSNHDLRLLQRLAACITHARMASVTVLLKQLGSLVDRHPIFWSQQYIGFTAGDDDYRDSPYVTLHFTRCSYISYNMRLYSRWFITWSAQKFWAADIDMWFVVTRIWAVLRLSSIVNAKLQWQQLGLTQLHCNRNNMWPSHECMQHGS